MNARKNIKPLIMQLLSDGYKPAEVAQMVGCSRVNVYEHIRQSRGWSGYVGPLPDDVVEALVAEAEASGLPVKDLARKIIEKWAQSRARHASRGSALVTGPGE